jgi:MFS family permease
VRRPREDAKAEDAQDRRPAIPREVWVLAGMAIVVALGFGIISPAIPLLADHFGVSHAVAGLAISAFALARFVSAYGNGKLVEKLGERPIMIWGLGIQAVMMVIAGLAPSYSIVIACRAVAGLGSAAFTVSSLSMVLRLARPESRGRAASIYQGGFLIGAVGGPAVGGFLTEITPRLPFVVYGICLGIAGVLAAILLPPAIEQDETPEHFDDPVLGEHAEEGQGIHYPVTEAAGHPHDQPRPLGLRSRAFLAAMAINLGNGWMLYGVRNALVPAYVTDELNHSATWAGGAFFLASLVQVAVLVKAGSLTDSWGRKPGMVIGATATLVASIVLVFPPQTGAFLLAMASLGIAAAFMSSAPAAVVGDVSQEPEPQQAEGKQEDGGSNGGKRGGKGIALFTMASDFGAVVGPIFAGWLVDTYSYSAAFVSCVVVLAFSTICCLIMQETRPAPAAAPQQPERLSGA